MKNAGSLSKGSSQSPWFRAIQSKPRGALPEARFGALLIGIQGMWDLSKRRKNEAELTTKVYGSSEAQTERTASEPGLLRAPYSS